MPELNRPNAEFPLPKIYILGVGNELLSDEGIGIHTIKALQQHQLPPNVELFEGGTDGFGLIHLIVEADRLIVIDSLKGGNQPGTLYKFEIEDAPATPNLFKTSVHQISILEVIHLSSLIGKTPKTTVIGVEPGLLTTGMQLSPDVAGKIPRVIELVLAEIQNSQVAVHA